MSFEMDGTVLVKYTGTEKHVALPRSVTRISDAAFRGCSILESVVIPSSVVNIGHSAFKECVSLTSVSLPSSVTNVDFATFKDCSALKSIAIPSSVTNIDAYAFSDCSSLESIVVPSSVARIGFGAFAKCSALAHATVRSPQTIVCEYAFDAPPKTLALPPSKLVIVAPKNSYAEQYAKKNGIRFEALDSFVLRPYNPK